jgi:hypothetical protein
MSDVFVIRNQLGQFWGKKKHWVDGRRRRKVATFKHQDEGLNQLVELSARDIELRGEVVAVEQNDSGLPVVEPSAHRIQDEEDLARETAGDDEDATAETGETEAADAEAAGHQGETTGEGDRPAP